MNRTLGTKMAGDAPPNAVEIAAELAIAWLGNPNTRVTTDQVLAFLKSMHETVSGLADALPTAPETSSEIAPTEEFVPAVSVRKSLSSRDHIISMIDGKRYKTLRRHLSTHGLTPEQDRERYNLKPDYPMVAPSYSEARRDMAKKIGLGAKGRSRRSAAKAR
ncbi:MAG: MucR family transcriptional regulator [Lysobacter sp.]